MINRPLLKLQLMRHRLSHLDGNELHRLFHLHNRHALHQDLRQEARRLLYAALASVAALIFATRIEFFYGVIAGLSISAGAVALWMLYRPSVMLGYISAGLALALATYNLLLPALPAIDWWVRLYGLLLGAWILHWALPHLRSDKWQLRFQQQKTAPELQRFRDDLWYLIQVTQPQQSHELLEITVSGQKWKLWLPSRDMCIIAYQDSATATQSRILRLLRPAQISFEQITQERGQWRGTLHIEGKSISATFPPESLERFRLWKSHMAGASWVRFSNN